MDILHASSPSFDFAASSSLYALGLLPTADVDSANAATNEAAAGDIQSTSPPFLCVRLSAIGVSAQTLYSFRYCITLRRLNIVQVLYHFKAP